MITLQQQRSWIEQHIVQSEADLPGQNVAWLNRARQQARQAISALPALDRQQEAWRYTSIEGLLKNNFKPAVNDEVAFTLKDIGHLLLPALDSYRLVFINGRFVSHLSCVDDLPAGVKLASLRDTLSFEPELLAPWLGHTADQAENVFTALNSALINDGLFLHIGSGIELDRPIEVIYLGQGDAAMQMMQLRNLVVLEKAARAELVERYIGIGQSRYFQNILAGINLAEGASLQHYRVQDESREAWHLGSLYLSQASNSHYSSTDVSLGAAWARTDYNAGFEHENASCELNGLYAVGDKQLVDFHLNVQHKVPACTSRERFRGILYGKGRAVFDGHILVARQAQKSDAQLTNDNLILTRSAEVDTKPQLEIYADDVKCSHGTTVGQLDPQQVFYLRSRGIDEATARSMLSLGFASDILGTIGIPALRESIADRLTDTLAVATATVE